GLAHKVHYFHYPGIRHFSVAFDQYASLFVSKCKRFQVHLDSSYISSLAIDEKAPVSSHHYCVILLGLWSAFPCCCLRQFQGDPRMPDEGRGDHHNDEESKRDIDERDQVHVRHRFVFKAVACVQIRPPVSRSSREGADLAGRRGPGSAAAALEPAL